MIISSSYLSLFHRRLDSNKLQHLPKNCLDKLGKLMKIKLDKNPWVMTAYLLYLYSPFFCFIVSQRYTLNLHNFVKCFFFSILYSIAIVRQFISHAFYANIIKSFGMEMEEFQFVLDQVCHDFDSKQDSITFITFLTNLINCLIISLFLFLGVPTPS